MIGHLIVIAIGAAIVGAQTSKRSGKVWAYLTTISYGTLAALLIVSSVLLFLRPDYAPLPDDLGQIRGRGAIVIVIGLWVFFHSIGPKGTGLILGGIGLFLILGVRGSLAAIRSGDYAGMDELDKQTEYLAIAAKVKALSEANEADSKWIEAQKAKTFPSREEAEKAAAAINAVIARRSARWREMQALVAEAKKLKPGPSIPPSGTKESPSAAA
jgi:hypothetical protein